MFFAPAALTVDSATRLCAVHHEISGPYKEAEADMAYGLIEYKSKESRIVRIIGGEAYLHGVLQNEYLSL